MVYPVLLGYLVNIAGVQIEIRGSSNQIKYWTLLYHTPPKFLHPNNNRIYDQKNRCSNSLNTFLFELIQKLVNWRTYGWYIKYLSKHFGTYRIYHVKRLKQLFFDLIYLKVFSHVFSPTTSTCGIYNPVEHFLTLI